MSSHNKYSLYITQPAIDDIVSIATYTEAQWGADQRQSYTDALKSTILQIAESPDIGRERYGVPSVIRGRKSGSHVVFYRLDGEVIYIMRILHESMDHGRHLNKGD